MNLSAAGRWTTKSDILKFNMPRYLGQHFLINKKKIRKIVEALELKDGDVVVEIGPGHGELTFNLKSQISNLRIIAIEKDRRLAKNLKEKFQSDKNIEIIEGDALKILPKLITQLPNYPIANYKLVGNIPYYITGYLLRILGELGNPEQQQAVYGAGKPSLIVLLIQKEVAERVCAAPPKMNLLAASVQFWAKPKIVGYISKKYFKPMPKIDSAIIKFTTYDKQFTTNDAKNYYKFIKILFKQPRKTILNNLISNYQFLISKQDIIKKLTKAGVNPQSRPQDLNIEQIKKLTSFLERLPQIAR